MLSSLKSNGTSSTLTDFWASLRPFQSSIRSDPSSKGGLHSRPLSVDACKFESSSSSITSTVPSSPQHRSLFSKSLKPRVSLRTRDDRMPEPRTESDRLSVTDDSYQELSNGDSFSKGSESISISNDKLDISKDFGATLCKGNPCKEFSASIERKRTSTEEDSISTRFGRGLNVRGGAQELGCKAGDRFSCFATVDRGMRQGSTRKVDLNEMSRASEETHKPKSSGTRIACPLNSKHRKEANVDYRGQGCFRTLARCDTDIHPRHIRLNEYGREESALLESAASPSFYKNCPTAVTDATQLRPPILRLNGEMKEQVSYEHADSPKGSSSGTLQISGDSVLTAKQTNNFQGGTNGPFHSGPSGKIPTDKHFCSTMIAESMLFADSKALSSPSNNDLRDFLSPVKLPDTSRPGRLHMSNVTLNDPASFLSAAIKAVRPSANIEQDGSYSRPSIDIRTPNTLVSGYGQTRTKPGMESSKPGQKANAKYFSNRDWRKGSCSSLFSVDTEGPIYSTNKSRESLDSYQGFLISHPNASSLSRKSRRCSLTYRGSGDDDLHPEPAVVPIELILGAIPTLRLSDFDLRATVGTGTFGRVRMCKLKNSENQTPLAMKILKKTEVIRLKQIEHVKSEKDILKRIRHPFIVNLFATFQDNRRLFMVMEFVHGGELFSYLRKEGRIDNNGGRFYASEITIALQYLHSLNIVYRDLKPENLLIDGHGHIKITDFGFAKIVKDRTWTVCGTPEYLAPEVIQSKGHGKSVDWWALGILIFEMLAGYPPFYDENPFGIYQKVLAGKINFPKYIDIRAKDLVKRLLSHDRTKRFGCMKGGAEDIKLHKWFKSINWDQCLRKQIIPPFIPETKSLDDTSMFDTYPESIEGSGPIVSLAEQDLFRDF